MRITLKFFITIIFSLTVAFVYYNTNSALLKDGTEGLVKTQDARSVLNSIESNQAKNNKADTIKEIDETMGNLFSSNEMKCFTFAEIQKDLDNDLLDKFAYDNLLQAFFVPQYLTNLDKSALKAEFDAGNAVAAFVLGMNLFYSSYTTSFHSPFLISPDIEKTEADYGAPLNEIDRQKLKEARKWLWKAAINDVELALTEIVSTYQFEHDYLASISKENINGLDDKEEEFIELKARATSYALLHWVVSPHFIELRGGQVGMHKSLLNELKIYDKQQYFRDLETSWITDRSSIGRTKEIELPIPNELKDVLKKIKNVCKD